MQESLGRVLGSVQDLSLDLSQAIEQGDYSTAMLHAERARENFLANIGTLNTQVAGQSLFAGTATDKAALAPGGRDPRAIRRAGRRRHHRRRRLRRDRRLFLQVAAGRLLHHAATSAPAPTSRRCRSARASRSTTACAPRTTGWSRC